MREKLLYVVLIGAMTAGYVSIRERITFAPNVGHPVTASKSLKPSSTFSQKHKHTVSKGVIHEGRSTHPVASAQSSRLRKDEELADAATEIESLTSIYENQKGRDESVEIESKPQPVPRIAGVKVAAWVQSQNNFIPTSIPDPNSGGGIRVFLNCMELKKQGLKPISSHDCESIASRERQSPSRIYE